MLRSTHKGEYRPVGPFPGCPAYFLMLRSTYNGSAGGEASCRSARIPLPQRVPCLGQVIFAPLSFAEIHLKYLDDKVGDIMVIFAPLSFAEIHL